MVPLVMNVHKKVAMKQVAPMAMEIYPPIALLMHVQSARVGAVERCVDRKE